MLGLPVRINSPGCSLISSFSSRSPGKRNSFDDGGGGLAGLPLELLSGSELDLVILMVQNWTKVTTVRK